MPLTKDFDQIDAQEPGKSRKEGNPRYYRPVNNMADSEKDVQINDRDHEESDENEPGNEPAPPIKTQRKVRWT